MVDQPTCTSWAPSQNVSSFSAAIPPSLLFPPFPNPPSIPVANRRGSWLRAALQRGSSGGEQRVPGGDTPPLWCLNPGRKGHLIKALTDPHIFYSLTMWMSRKQLARPFAHKPPSETAGLYSTVDAFRVDTTRFSPPRLSEFGVSATVIESAPCVYI